MLRHNKRWTTGLAAVGLLLALSQPAFAIFPSLSTSLSGPSLGGQVPQGDAKVDQSKLMVGSLGQLQMRVKNVNLPDGTFLNVTIDGLYVGTVILSRGEGSLSTFLLFQVGRQSPIVLKNGGVTILSGGMPWQT